MGLCPYCKTTLSSVNIEGIDGNVSYTPSWKAITYSCPFCQSILSVQIDPVALKTDIVDEVIKKIKR
jgi:hypothetical protein